MEARIGDVIEDYCTQCGHLLDHSIAALVNGQVVKVSCRTCHREHAYKHGQEPKRKKTQAKQSAFEQVLAGILATQSGEAPAASPPANPRKTRRNK